jgi:hypothetical protein
VQTLCNYLLAYFTMPRLRGPTRAAVGSAFLLAILYLPAAYTNALPAPVPSMRAALFSHARRTLLSHCRSPENRAMRVSFVAMQRPALGKQEKTMGFAS